LISGVVPPDRFLSGIRGARFNMAHDIVNIKILDARVFVSDAKAFWAVRLYVGNEYSDVSGLVYLDPEQVDLRFEELPIKAAPDLSPENEMMLENALNAITTSSGMSVMVLEMVLKSFLNNCVFCLSPVSSTFDTLGVKRAVSYRHRGKQYTIKDKGTKT
jgi:hypothetical protein